MASAQMPSIDYRSFLQLHHADGQSAQEIECGRALKLFGNEEGVSRSTFDICISA